MKPKTKILLSRLATRLMQAPLVDINLHPLIRHLCSNGMSHAGITLDRYMHRVMLLCSRLIEQRGLTFSLRPNFPWPRLHLEVTLQGAILLLIPSFSKTQNHDRPKIAYLHIGCIAGACVQSSQVIKRQLCRTTCMVPGACPEAHFHCILGL